MKCMGLDKLEKHRFSTLDAVGSHMLLIEAVVNCPPWTLYFEVSCPPDTLLRSCPPDTLLRSKLSPGHFTSKQTVPSQGGQSTSRGVTLLRSRVSGASSLLRSKVSGGGGGGQFTLK